MDTTDYVKRYQKELAENKKNNVPFNVWAFLFSSLYFFYVRMYGHFLIFFFSPLLLDIIFTALARVFGLALSQGDCFPFLFIIFHFVAAFIANPNYKKFKQRFVQEHKDVDTSIRAVYSSMPLGKFVLYLVLSYGLYGFYWGFKNWQKYCEATKDDVYPLARAIFFPVTILLLFRKIAYSVEAKSNFLWQGCVYLAIYLFWFTESFVNLDVLNNPVFEGVFSVSSVIVATCCLASVQAAINRYNLAHGGEKAEKDVGGIVFVVITFALTWGVFIVSLLFPNNKNSFFDSYSEEQQIKIAQSVGFIYRHTKVYSQVCAQNGYVLKNYPNVFSEYYAADILKLKEQLLNNGVSLKDVEQIMFSNPEAVKKIQDSAYEELYGLWMFLRLAQAAEEQGIAIENVKWDNQWNASFDIQNICAFFDLYGLEILKDGDNKDFLKERAL